MKPQASRNLLLTSLILATALAGSPFGAAALTWTGLSTVTNLWSDTNNWSPTQPLTFDNQAIFGNGVGSTNLGGAVNNVADADVTLTNLVYSGLFTNLVATNFHTTQINDGVTLTVKATNSSAVIYVGTGVDNGANASNYTAIVGTGRLVVGDPASPSAYSNCFMQVKQASASSGAHRAVLDLSGLDNFTFAAGKFLVAANGTFGGSGDRVQGSVYLAKTNVITCSAPWVTDPSEYLNEQPFTIGQSQGSQSAATFTNVVLLGQENTINADYFRIGGLKMIGQVSFKPGLANPTLKLRAADGVSRVPQIVLGDSTESRVVSFLVKGNLDLRAGSVDALVQNLYLARNGWRDVSTDNTGGAFGLMMLGAGTFDVTTANIGCQQGDNAGNARGNAVILTNATLAAGTINIGRKAGTTGTGSGIGLLVINGGLVTVTGNVIENDAPGANGSSTIIITNGGTLNLMPPGDTIPGNITVDTLTLGSATLTNYSTLSLSTLNVLAPATEFTLYPGQALNAVAPGVAGTLTVNGNLTLAGGTLRLDLNSPGVNDLINVNGILTLSGLNTVDVSAAGGSITPGTYTILFYTSGMTGDTNNLQVTGALANSRYSFAFDTTAPNVNITVSGATTNLTWSGDGLANLWDLRSTANWNNQTELFYDLDAVTFDDTSTNQLVNLAGTLVPASLTVNGSKNYTLASTGKISGTGGLVNNGSGILTILSANDYTGDTAVNAGALLVNGSLGLTTVNVNNGATLGGSGTILGPVNVSAGATFSPGVSIGTLTIANNLVLADASTSVFEANLDTLTADQVVGLRTVTYGGTLSLVLSGRPVAVTDTFKLFSATTLANAYSTPYPGLFSAILPAAPGPASLAWNTNSLGIDGTLRVVSTAPTTVTFQLTGTGQFTLSWPADHIGWRLQRQVDGLTGTWTDVGGSTTTNVVVGAINPAYTSVFYRLVFP